MKFTKENKKYQKQAKLNKKSLQEFFDYAPEAIIIMDLETMGFVNYNESALRLLRFSDAELARQNPLTISPEFQQDGRRSEEKTQELIAKVIEGEKPVFEWLVRTGNGEMIICEVRLILLSNNAGKVQIYASFVDVTDRKRNEEEISLQYKKLSEIAFLQSHQVRQPISSILGLINLYNFKKPNDPLNAELLLKIQTVTKQFDEIIRDIVNQTIKVKNLVFGCKIAGGQATCNPTSDCHSRIGCFREQKIDV